MFGEHGLSGHGRFYYEPLIRVPLIMAGPELPKGKQIKSPISLVDLVPTIQDFLGINSAHKIHGQSLEPLIKQNLEREKALFFDGNSFNLREGFGCYALIMGSFKLILNRTQKRGENIYKLYNLQDDPEETTDIKKTNPEMFKQLKKALGNYVVNVNKDRMKKLQQMDNNTDTSKNWETTKKELETLGYID